MSRTGKKPIEAVSGVTVAINDRVVTAKGPKGEQSLTLMDIVNAKQTDQGIVIEPANDTSEARAAWGTTRALIANMVKGVKDGYSIPMEIYGTGYTCKLEGKKLMLNVGFMGRGVGKVAQFVLDVPPGVDVKVEVPAARGNNEPAKFTISGVDKQVVGDFAASVRKIRKPEPYQGKGIRYAGEHVRRKAGKVFAGGSA